jgi:MoaA/NifB/PqqE/SkfB family radical SAM enzyme
MNNNILCAVPLTKSWTDSRGRFRNCCTADPQIHSAPGQTFAQWWNSTELNSFRESLKTSELPPSCYRCAFKESNHTESFRTAVNKDVDFENTDFSWPSQWDIKFGNKCNLACWTCSETASSLIMQHKKKIKILSESFNDPEIEFSKNWKVTRLNFLKSYDVHDVVTLTVTGGEPMFNKKFLLFLQELVDLGLSTRTKLEIHTNGSYCNARIKKLLLHHLWKYVCVFVSVDAVGPKASWLRYGSDWKKIVANIKKIQKLANYVEINCVLSVLNINNLVDLKNFCNQLDLKLQITTISHPEFMKLDTWCVDRDLLCNKQDLIESGYGEYYNLLGSSPDEEMYTQLQSYIKSFDAVRRPLKDFDSKLATILGLA